MRLSGNTNQPHGPKLAENKSGDCTVPIGNGPNTVSGSTVSNTELSEFFGAHRVPGSELSEFLSAYYLWVNANSPSFPRTHRVCPKTQ